MNLERTPPPAGASASDPPVDSSVVEPSACQVCHITMTEGLECLILNECSHPFHRQCIEEYLSNASECPVCKKPCQLSELRVLKIVHRSVPPFKGSQRGKGRGAMPRHYQTRSTTREFQDTQYQQLNRSLDFPSTPDRSNLQTNPSRGISPARGLSQPAAVHSVQIHAASAHTAPMQSAPIHTAPVLVDYSRIDQLIETNLSRMLQNMNFAPPANANRNIPSSQRPLNNLSQTMNNVSDENIRSHQLSKVGILNLTGLRMDLVWRNFCTGLFL
ncbi:uncharacterized protein LOC131996926 [Stomoxys calcitrans]|uniref:uncharacterized protein LOC131996926 n=1 Tax=Stomoxys calcitrans TaxID=35570 RepID=UPI0027E2C664|nr:uncharacterized protein LOC131996926 [Stomoxys calcitrans]